MTVPSRLAPMRLRWIVTPVAPAAGVPSMYKPEFPLPAITLPAAATAPPPIVRFEERSNCRPMVPFARGAVPAAFRPTMLPWITAPSASDTYAPSAALPEITLPSFSPTPPITRPCAPDTLMPRLFSSAAVPAASVPM